MHWNSRCTFPVTRGKQVRWMILLAWTKFGELIVVASGKVAAKLMLNSFWGKIWWTNKQTHQGVLEVKKVDVTSWKCHRLPWNSGSKVLPEQVIGCTHYWLWIGCTGTVIAFTRTMSGFLVVRGAHRNYWKQRKRCTSSTFMKCGIFPCKQRQTGLFTNYINTWLKVKQESSGWKKLSYLVWLAQVSHKTCLNCQAEYTVVPNRRNWYGRCKELWTKGAAGTGLGANR